MFSSFKFDETYIFVSGALNNRFGKTFNGSSEFHGVVKDNYVHGGERHIDTFARQNIFMTMKILDNEIVY